MNEEFEKYINKIKRMRIISIPIEIITAFFICVTVSAIVITIVEGIKKDFIIGLIWCSLLSLVFGLFMLYFKNKYKRLKKENNKCYEFPFDFTINYDDICKVLKNTKYLTKHKDVGNLNIFDFTEGNIFGHVFTNITLYKTSRFNKLEYKKFLENERERFYKEFKKPRPTRNDWGQMYNLIFIEN